MADGAVKDEEDKQLKAACHYYIAKISEDEGKKVDKKVTKQSVACLTELFYGYAQTFATDVECFARHAKRATVQPDDVRLCARRSDSLYTEITNKMEELEEAATAKKAQRKGGKKRAAKQEEEEDGVGDQEAEKPKVVAKKRKTKGSKCSKDADSDEGEEDWRL